MPPVEKLIPYVAPALAGFVVGALAVWLLAQRRFARVSGEATALRARVEALQARGEERERAFSEARERMMESFSSLSSEALRQNNDAFLRLAQERLGQYQVQAKAELGEREKAVEDLVKPVREALERTEKQLRDLEKARLDSYSALNRHLETMTEVQRELRSETGNLVKALRRPEVRGQWGEMTLRRLVELAGMVDHCDFYEQEHRDSDAGALRPDMVVRMPSGREVIVDAKTPLDAYVDAVEATDDATRRQALERHGRGLRRQVAQLSEKAYWRQFSGTPDFVVLFIPGEQFLTAALDQDRDLLEYALRNRIILATPTTLVALLRAVAFGWRQETLAENAERIRELGESLYNRIATFTEHLGRLGRSLGSSVDHYNRAVGSLERQVMPAARRFSDLGVEARKDPECPPELERAARSPQPPEEDV
ncbi:MAG: DNA recombination protein RmuC [Ectothiorhodospiraceae bacterium]|jgi:DNA recombination protein RmuC